jgi:hypothetical protein
MTSDAHSPPPAATSTQQAEAPSNAAPTFASVWQTAHAPPKNAGRLIWASLAALAVLLVTGVLIAVGTSLVGHPAEVRAADEKAAQVAQASRKSWLEDVLEAQHSAALPDPFNAPRAAVRRPRGAAGAARLATAATGRSSRRRTSNAARSAAGRDAIDPRYAAYFGSSSRYAHASVHASSVRAKTLQVDAAGKKSGGVQGLSLRARLKDQVADSPAGAPVVALLTRRTPFNGMTLPAGSEVHGTVMGTGNEGTRIFIEFHFIRQTDGQHTPIVAVARDEMGRYGIAGKKLFNGRSAGSVGVSAATRVLGAAGRRLAGTVGDILGAGIEGATESGTRKAQRADGDEYVLVADPGAPLAIYVTALGRETSE